MLHRLLHLRGLVRLRGLSRLRWSAGAGVVGVLLVGFPAPVTGAGASWLTWVDSLLGAAEPVGAGGVPIGFVTGACVLPGP